MRCYFLLICSFALSIPAFSQSAQKDVQLAMSLPFFKKETSEYVIASPLKGVLLYQGKPLADTLITRHMRWTGNEDKGELQEFYTDKNGSFDLPLYTKQLTLNVLTEFFSTQQITVSVDNTPVDIWYSGKVSNDLWDDTGGESLRALVCDPLAVEVAVYYEGSGSARMLTRCRWEGMPEDHQEVQNY
ncbi:DUF4198 domain-containing protein [Agaribacterium haliotis]|uniref:DUF4198 domain-containing protein n=1 Tax=Agaribacterium haliotis TaxID=2013869 RepID=UPI001177C9F2|nr:DUF4198 domain-containing protein [Agaribacterium haliotis]